MSDSVTTRLDAPYAQQPETRAAAVRAMVRLGAADLLDMLGLTDLPEPEPQAECGICGRPVPPQVSQGGCRRTAECRSAARRRLRAGGAQ